MNQNKTISIGADHAGFEYKTKIIELLKKKGYEILDHGTDSTESTDYPDHIHPVAHDVSSKKAFLGFAICGSGNGVCMTANKHQDIRAALCWNEELAELARLHNDANILCIPARFIDYNVAEAMVEIFLKTAFEGGRHQNRVNKIACN